MAVHKTTRNATVRTPVRIGFLLKGKRRFFLLEIELDMEKILSTGATYRQNPLRISYNALKRVCGNYVTILDGMEPRETPVPPGKPSTKSSLKMKIANYVLLALLLTFASSIVSPVPAQEPTTTVVAPGQLNLMPVPASVQLQTGRLAITNAFSVATKGYADDRLRGSITRMTRRLAGRTGETMGKHHGADVSRRVPFLPSKHR